jgi:hypothetical protein
MCDCLQVCNSQLDNQVGCRRSWRCSQLKSDQQTFQEGRQTEMATEGHRCGQGEDHSYKYKELEKVRAEIEKMMLKMQQEAQGGWTYEWPLKRKVKWPVQKLLARGQQQVLKRWLRHAENLSDTEEELVFICEPEFGKTLSDEEGRSVKGLINCQEGRDEFSNFQVGNEMRSIEDFIDCQEGSSENSYFQVGNEMGSAEDLIDCQEGKGEILDFQVGKGSKMRLSESLRRLRGKFISTRNVDRW